MTSIRKQLLWTLPPATLALLAIAVLAVLHEVRDEISELFDAQLVEAAMGVPADRTFVHFHSEGNEDDPGSEMVVMTRENTSADVTFYSSNQVLLPPDVLPGFTTITLNSERWRVYTAPTGKRTVQAGQPMRIREEASLAIAGRALLPLLLVIPAVILTVLMLVKRGLKPLTHFARELNARRPDSLGSLELVNLPAELVPMATAMNELLTRLATALNAQEIFVADAAHELLTPLAALRVQVQMLDRARSDERREQAMRDLRAGLERCIGLARQLLTLARQSADQPSESHHPVQLANVVRVAVADVLVKAHSRSIDLGMTSEADCVVSGDEKALQTLLSNLLDNAVKYAPVHGRVDVAISVRDNGAVVTVSDSGPGIHPVDEPRVFDRFYRSRTVDVEGSGLGLAIAREIASRHDAHITLRTPGRLGGLDAEVHFVRK